MAFMGPGAHHGLVKCFLVQLEYFNANTEAAGYFDVNYKLFGIVLFVNLKFI